MFPRRAAIVSILAALALAGVPCAADDFGVSVPLTRAASGNFYVDGTVGSTTATRFLVDTGSGLTTVNEKTFARLRERTRVTLVRHMAARLADGGLTKVAVYRVEHFRIGENCDLGSAEVAVLGSDSANILGLDTLSRAAPFAFHVDPPRLALSQCAAAGELLAAH